MAAQKREASEDPSFPGVIGHHRATQMLLRALAHDRLHHALLLSGPEGIGKARFAQGLACALLCQNQRQNSSMPPFGAGCGQCRECARVLRNTHPDYLSIGPSGASQRIARDTMHQEILRLGHAPHEGRAHLCVIDPADRMTPDAANVLLKMLEEPPPGVYIVLIATNPRAVLPTLTSRSLPIALGTLTQEQCETVLQEQLQQKLLPADYEEQSPEDLDSLSSDAQALRQALRENKLQELPAYRAALALAKGRPGKALQLLHDPALAATQNLCQTLQRYSENKGAIAAIFGGDKHPLWSTWQDTVATHPDPSAAAKTKTEADPVEVVKAGARKSSRKKSTKKKASKKKSSKKKSSAAKKPSLAQQRSALLLLSEVWQLDLQDRIRNHAVDPRRSVWLSQMRALEVMRRNCHANINPRLLLEHTLAEIAQHSASATPSG